MKIKFGGRRGTLLYVFLGILLAFAINLVLGQVLSTDVPFMAVQTNSMAPTFCEGDALVIQGVRDPEDYLDFLEIGDVIVFSVEGHEIPIAHRISQINPDGSFQTLSDSALIYQQFLNHQENIKPPYEKHIEPEQIHGKVIYIISYLGWAKIGPTKYLLPFISENIVPVVAVILAIAGVYFYMFRGQGRKRIKRFLFAGNGQTDI